MDNAFRGQQPKKRKVKSTKAATEDARREILGAKKRKEARGPEQRPQNKPSTEVSADDGPKVEQDVSRRKKLWFEDAVYRFEEKYLVTVSVQVLSHDTVLLTAKDMIPHVMNRSGSILPVNVLPMFVHGEDGKLKQLPELMPEEQVGEHGGLKQRPEPMPEDPVNEAAPEAQPRAIAPPHVVQNRLLTEIVTELKHTNANLRRMTNMRDPDFKDF